MKGYAQKVTVKRISINYTLHSAKKIKIGCIFRNSTARAKMGPGKKTLFFVMTQTFHNILTATMSIGTHFYGTLLYLFPFEIGSLYLAHVGLEHVILLTQPPAFWHYRPGASAPGGLFFVCSGQNSKVQVEKSSLGRGEGGQEYI